MPQVKFDSGFKKNRFTDFNKLSLEQNERARICVIDNPLVEYVHSLNRVITVDGKPQMKTQSFPVKGGGTREREVPDTDYVGKFLCLGDFDILEDKNADPDNCPACKLSLETAAIDGPKRRFAVHVIKYQTKGKTFEVQSPFQIELLVWEFSETRFTTLIDIAKEHGSLPNLDLCLGPVQNKQFQKFDILPGGKCEWNQDEARKSITKQVITEQRYPDLTPLLGRAVSAAELQSQCMDVVHVWNMAFGVAGAMPVSDTEKAVEDAAVPTDVLGDLNIFGGSDDSTEAPSDTSEATDSSTDEDVELSLEELLNGVSK